MDKVRKKRDDGKCGQIDSDRFRKRKKKEREREREGEREREKERENEEYEEINGWREKERVCII